MFSATVSSNSSVSCVTTPIRSSRSRRRTCRDVDAAHQHGAGGGIVEPRHHIHQRRLAAAVGADDRDRLARLDAERHVVEHQFVRLVVKRHVAELDRAEQFRQWRGMRGIRDLRLAVEHLVQVIGRRGALLQRVEDRGQPANRVARSAEEAVEQREPTVR